MAGRPALFAAALERKYTLASSDDIEQALVDFYFDGQRIGRAITDDHGSASLSAAVGSGRRPMTYLARAYYKGKRVEASGRVFYWNPHKTVVAVDVDETISHTHYSDLFLADLDKHSRPLEGSAQALWQLTRDYELLYISARPRFLNEKTRRWLATHRFPPGPVANASKFEACFHQRRYKQEMLAKLRQRFPNILIGVGDKKVDDRVYGANGMVSIIIDKPLFTKYGNHCFVFPDWQRAAEFFDQQHTRLSDADHLTSLVASNGMNLRQVFASPPPPPEPPQRDVLVEHDPGPRAVARAGTFKDDARSQ
jgi:hypothetical protein